MLSDLPSSGVTLCIGGTASEHGSLACSSRKGPGPFPAVLEIHGGAWTSGDRTDNGARDEALATAGIVVVAIDFRLGTESPYPASIADVNYATRWLKRHASDFNAFSDPIGGLGFSSGGHMIRGWPGESPASSACA
jgi:acetyl esterase/lipase